MMKSEKTLLRCRPAQDADHIAEIEQKRIALSDEGAVFFVVLFRAFDALRSVAQESVVSDWLVPFKTPIGLRRGPVMLDG
jgi:hypothetical protein